MCESVSYLPHNWQKAQKQKKAMWPCAPLNPSVGLSGIHEPGTAKDKD